MCGVCYDGLCVQLMVSGHRGRLGPAVMRIAGDIVGACVIVPRRRMTAATATVATSAVKIARSSSALVC